MKRVALYLRRSTDGKLQPESLVVQEDRLRAYAAAHELEVVEVFADSASGLSVKGRAEFLRLLKVVEQGARFEEVLVRDVSRWGRWAETDMSAYFEMYLLLHGVTVRYAEEQFTDAPKPYNTLLKALRRMSAAEFSREKGRLIQAAQMHAVEKGFRVSGEAPFGMKRVIVTNEGKHVRSLRPKENKGLRPGRVKLAPGRADAAGVVKDIFRWFVEDREKLSMIARRLNDVGILTPREKVWTTSSVRQVLENPAYGGICRYTFKASQNLSAARTIEVPGAWPGLVSEGVFRLAQKRLDAKPRPAVDEQLCAASQLWSWVPESSPLQWESIRRTFPNGAIARERVGDFDADAEEVVAALLSHFEHAEATETGGYLLNGSFELGLRFSFPLLYNGRLTWDFQASTSVPEDATLFIGLSPPPATRCVALFLVFTRRLKRLGKRYRPEISAKRFRQLATLTMDEVVSRITYFLYSGPKAEHRLLEAMHGLRWTNTAQLARLFGWPESAAYSVYYRLRKRGVSVPPLVWHAKRRVKWSCDRCGAAEDLTLRAASRRRSDLCRACLEAESARRRVRVFSCAVCGGERRLKLPPVEDRYKSGKAAEAMCRSCSGKRNIARAQAEAFRRAALLRRAYRRLAVEMVNVLRRRRDPGVEDVDGLARLVYFTNVDGSRRFVRLLIRHVDVAARILLGGRSSVARLARGIAGDPAIWNSTKKVAPVSVDVREYLDMNLK
jgi:DNA invertase Pin-like site-specific DNA recombinase